MGYMLQIFNVFYKNKNKIEKIYVFGSKKDLTKTEISKLEKYKCDIEYVNAYIHLDDNVEILRKKMFYFLKSKIPIEEMYLFSKRKEIIKPEKLFNYLTQNQTINLDYQTIYNYFLNLNETNILKKIKEGTENYTYDEFKKMVKENEYTVDFSIGIKFTAKKTILNTNDPYKFTNIDKILKNNFDLLFTSENKKLLFEYGSFLDNNIYLTHAEDVLKFYDDSKENDILKSYFPSLFMKLQKNNNLTFKNKMNRKIDLFYNINKEKLSLNMDYGIQKIMFTIHQENKMKIPLDTLFKLIKTNINIPFIKYNPGNRRENIYRLFTNKMSTNGKKIPVLSNVKKRKNKIIKISQVLATKKKIGFLIRHRKDSNIVDIFCEILENGLIEVRINKFGDGEHLKTVKEIETIIQESVNKNIEINNIDYVFKIENDNNLDLTENTKLISNIFEVSQSVLTNSKKIKMRYKKISNYNKMNGINSFIIEQMQISRDIDYIVKILMNNYNISLIDAKTKVSNVINEMKVQMDLFENKKVFRDHPGFPIEIKQITDIRK